MKKSVLFFFSLLSVVVPGFSIENEEAPDEVVDSCLTPLDEKIVNSVDSEGDGSTAKEGG